MPKKTERQQLLQTLLKTLKQTTLLEILQTDCRHLKNFQNDVLLMMRIIEGNRYLHFRTPVPKQLGYRNLLKHLPPKEIRQAIRMDIESFGRLVAMIEDHPVFHNSSQNPQLDVWIQLAVALERMGSHGTGVAVVKVSVLFGIGAGTVILYCRRVIQAILSLKSTYALWPSAHARRIVSCRLQEEKGLGGLVGIVDGTDIILHQKPCVDPEVYWTRKHRYALNCQLVVHPNDGRILYYLIGWPGSLHDNNVFSKSRLFQFPDEFFSDGEYLLGDSAFALTLRMLTPYKGQAAGIPENALFNQIISAVRVVVEHGIGVLKNRWGSLKHLRLSFMTADDLQHINNWILATIILHNILITFRDTWQDADELDEVSNGSHTHVVHMGGATAEAFRTAKKRSVLSCPYNYM